MNDDNDPIRAVQPGVKDGLKSLLAHAQVRAQDGIRTVADNPTVARARSGIASAVTAAGAEVGPAAELAKVEFNAAVETARNAVREGYGKIASGEVKVIPTVGDAKALMSRLTGRFGKRD